MLVILGLPVGHLDFAGGAVLLLILVIFALLLHYGFAQNRIWNIVRSVKVNKDTLGIMCSGFAEKLCVSKKSITDR